MFEPILKPKDQPKRRRPNPEILPDGRWIFLKPSKAWDEQRLKVYCRDEGRCVDCGPHSRVLYFNGGEFYNRAEIDHVKAKRMGRDAFTDDRLENLVTRCHEHHRRKHDKSSATTAHAAGVGLSETDQRNLPADEGAVQGKTE